LSHFLLTEKLLPKLSASSSERGGSIVQISSSYHWAVDGSDLTVTLVDKEGKAIMDHPVASLAGGSHGYELWRTTRQYANSKLAQILHMRALQRRTNNVTVVSVCPSWVSSNIAASTGTPVHDFMKHWMFPVDGFGLSSILRATLAVNSNAGAAQDYREEGDYYTNSALVPPFGRWIDHIPSWLSKHTPIRDVMGSIGAVGLLFHFQKIFPAAMVVPSSKASYNEMLQEQLYQWSYQQVSKWL
jgi:NAD(P)-dependent dehydrogenase (short-subunit alcohol dehydrogenase family)